MLKYIKKIKQYFYTCEKLRLNNLYSANLFEHCTLLSR